MPLRRSRAVLALALLLAANRAPAAPAASHALMLRFDPDATRIAWTLDAPLHTVHGTFALKSGWLTYDPATSQTRGEFVVDLRSGASGNADRDRKMQDQVLESNAYPFATYVPTAVAITETSPGTEEVATSGTLAIHGGDHPLKMDVTLHTSGNAATAETRFEIPYAAWGMHDPSTFFLRVGKVVDVDVTAKGSLEVPR